jgi:hypothetical protein
MASGFFLLFRPSGESQSKDERLNHEGHEEHEEEQDEFFFCVVRADAAEAPVQVGRS